jgi:hypothetical protein
MIDAVSEEKAQAATTDQQPILEAKGISKAFGHVQAAVATATAEATKK